ncbi:SusC/RagA family TonB-linked outer membrane protein [Pontibacter silvestris]|uniref:SusC/RagA family TonB-linked outer membrane protein n=1 Tax=Pontibacter silvestris TaxID=2305183 RepID=A0ABW4X1D2_9BACT|nr:SusC/RagA family TonB-linked outer membrane protein [Pontibacter silvestris]MCC9138849.1 SusC/RagA family TonB-linked outer membrane protein [Pontibacter silvestris]
MTKVYISIKYAALQAALKFLLLLTVLLGSVAVLHAQAHDLQQKVSLDYRNASTETVIKELNRQTAVSFTYDKAALEDVKIIEIKFKGAPLNDVLRFLSDNVHLEFIILSNTIVVHTAKTPAKERAKAQQEKTITGRVTDENGEGLPGVTVMLKGTTRGVPTDVDGNFSLTVPDNEAILVFSYLGMKSQEVTVGNLSTVNVVMEVEESGLEEVVVIGYGVARKKDITGSIATLEGEVAAKRNTTQLSQALQGTMPGVMVTRSNSEPGATASVRVRGITTIGDSNPLVVVDGVPVSSMNDVNAADIEDISVLKDAASASIYGARAAAGVILITTKRAKSNETSLEYRVNVGFDKPTAFPETVGAQRYLEMINEFTWNDAGNNAGGEYGLYSKDDVENWAAYNKDNPNQYPITDWLGMIVKDYAPRTSHYLSFSGGSGKVKTHASLNYEHVDALYDHKSFERVMSRVNNSIEISDQLSANVDFAFNYTANKAPTVNPIWDAQRYPAVFPALWDDGRIAEGQNGSNAYAALHNGGFDNSWTNRINGRISLKYQPIESLSFTGVVSPYFHGTKGKEFRKQIPYYSDENPTQLLGYISGYTTTSLYESRNDGKTFTKQFLANYKKGFQGHSFNLLGGYEDYYAFGESLNAQAENYTLSNFPYLDLGPLDYMNNSGSAWETAYRSFFGRLMYDYKNKYLLQANIRYDGSSRLHPDYRWGSFPSVSAGWVVSEEPFMPQNSALSHLKLRASWGQLGNERIGNYPYQASIGYSNALFYQGSNVVSATTAAQYYYAIHDISWETTETVDFGVDAYFFGNRLMFTGDYYRKKTRDMLLELEIPDYMGFENPQQNTGKMYTNGWDAELMWRDNIGQLGYSVSLNLSDSRSKMGNLGGIVFDGSQITKEGSEYNEWYGYLSDGLYQTEDEVNNSAKLYSSVRPGDIKYKDISGPEGIPDGKITPDYDRVLLGGSLPRYLYGGNINLDYKGFDLTLAFQGVGKQNSRLTEQMVKPFFSAWTNPPLIIDGNYWSLYNTEEENLNAKYPRLSYTGAENNNYVMSDYWMINGAYFRLKNIVLGYTLPRVLTSKVKMDQVRIYASATDLFSVDKYPEGWDPEVSYNTYISKTFNFGLSVKF